MSIKLWTGLPGAGKSQRIIKYILDFRAEDPSREIWVCNVDGLLDNELNVNVLEDANDWHKLPDGCLVIIDEAQQFFRPGPASKDPPQSLTELEKHRHRGFDIIFCTQHGSTLHTHIRKFVEYHWHIHRPHGMQMAVIHKHQGYQSQAYDRKIQAFDKETFKYSEDYWKYYKSAEVHNVKRSIPKKYFLYLLLPVLFIFCIYYGFNSFFKNSDSIVDPNAIDNESGDVISSGRSRSSNSLTYAQAYTPELENIPWSAPIYREVLKPVTYPKPHCIINVTQVSCSCYTQQATTMDIGLQNCLHYARFGYFDPTKPDVIEAERIGQGISDAARAPASPSQLPPRVHITRTAGTRIPVLGSRENGSN